MKNEVPIEERLAGVTVGVMVFFGIYIFIKLKSIKMLWPFTWVDSFMTALFYALFYVGLPLLVLWGIYWCINGIAKSRVDELRLKANAVLDEAFNRIEANKKSSEAGRRKLEEELKALKKEFLIFKGEQEERNVPIHEVQEQTLQNFL